MLGQEILITISNRKNNFLVLGEDPTFGIWFTREKKIVLILVKKNTKFCLSGKQTFKFTADNKTFNFPTQFCLGASESREVSLNGNVYDFSDNYNSIDKSYILNTQDYLMIKNK